MDKYLVFIILFFTVLIGSMVVRASYLTGYYDGFEKARLALTKGPSCELPHQEEK